MGLERMQSNNVVGLNYNLDKKQALMDNLDQPLWSSEFMKDILCHFTKEEVIRWGNPDFLKTITESHKRYFDGYTAYYFPDGGEKMNLIKKKSVWYGIGVAEKEGLEHIHRDSPAFNYTISGSGLFTGSGGLAQNTKKELIGVLPSHYVGSLMKPGTGFEIPAGMPHGHKVIDGPIVFFFVQECGFHEIAGINKDPCLGDFYRVGGGLSDVQQQISS